MEDKTDVRLHRILRRTNTLRRKRYVRETAGLSAVCVMLLAGICTFLRNVQAPGVSVVADRCGTVLLHGGAELYVLVGVLAFVCGAALTVFCIRWKTKQKDRLHQAEKEEETR